MSILKLAIPVLAALATALVAFCFHSIGHGIRSGPLDPPAIDWQAISGSAIATALFAAGPFVSLLGAWQLVQSLETARRRRRNNCLRCGYPLGKLDPCPECGASPSRAPPKRRLGTLLIYLALSIPLGSLTLATSELAVISDERAFRAEVRAAQASGLTRYGRARAWPNEMSSLMWSADRGYWCTD